jgi:hypothetical protein
MSNINEKKAWKIGGGIVNGIALGLKLKNLSPMPLPGFTLLGLGIGLFTAQNEN